MPSTAASGKVRTILIFVGPTMIASCFIALVWAVSAGNTAAYWPLTIGMIVGVGLTRWGFLLVSTPGERDDLIRTLPYEQITDALRQWSNRQKE